MEFHSIKEDESCINPSLVRIPFLVGHVMRVIRFVVGRCPRRRCHVIQLLNSLIIKDAATYPTKALHIETEAAAKDEAELFHYVTYLGYGVGLDYNERVKCISSACLQPLPSPSQPLLQKHVNQEHVKQQPQKRELARLHQPNRPLQLPCLSSSLQMHPQSKQVMQRSNLNPSRIIQETV